MSETAGGVTVEITDENFADEVENADGLVLIDFWAEWCGPCRIVSPIVEELANDYADTVKVGKLNVDANRHTSQRFNIRSIPSILFFKDGQLVDMVVGALPRAALEQKILEHT